MKDIRIRITPTSDLLIQSDRRNQIKKAVLSLLNETGIHSLPVMLAAIARRKHWVLMPLSKARERQYFKITEGALTGYTFIADKKRYIIYNDSDIKQRMRWTLAHEYGHILLNHTIISDVTEAEANYFAKQLLSPIAVLDAMDILTAAEIAKASDISMQAAKYRLKDLDRHYKYKDKYGWSKHDKLFLGQFGLSEFF